MNEKEEFPEIEALRQANDFPGPDAERDRKVKEAMRAKLKPRPVARSRWKVLAARWGVGVAATLVVGLAVAFYRASREEVTIARGSKYNAAPPLFANADLDQNNPQGWAIDAIPELREKSVELASVIDQYAEILPKETDPRGLAIGDVDADGFYDVAAIQSTQFFGRLSDFGTTTARWGPPGELTALTAQSDQRMHSFDPKLAPIQFARRQPPAASQPASATTWKPCTLTPNTTRLMVGDNAELPLQALQAAARIDGFRARVLLDLFFLNDRQGQLEGNFQLRLPPGASPYYLSFAQTVLKAPEPNTFFTSFQDPKGADLDPANIAAARRATSSQLTEARMVPREKAAHAYRETVRRVVDPALLEWSGAGIFSARVFPLAPGIVHRITIGYDLDLARSGGDLEYRFDLPAGVPETRVDFDAAEVPGAALEIEPRSEPVRSGGRARWHLENPGASSVTLRLKGAGPLLLQGADGTGSYFAASFRPELPAAAADSAAARAVFLVDTSLSSNPERFGLWLKLLRAILDGNRDTLRSFAVLFFNVETSWWQEKFIENTPENTAALLAFAEKLALEGATDLRSALAEAAFPRWLQKGGGPGQWDLFLLSDGASTWGERDSRAIAATLRRESRGPLFAYSTGLQGTDVAALGELARESGGSVFSVVGEGELAKASRAHRLRPWHIAGLELSGGSDLLLAGRPRAVYPGQDLLLVGRGSPPADAEVKLRLRRGEEEKTFGVKLGRAVSTDLAPRAYGQVAVGQLEELREATAEFSSAYANHFRVTGLSSSLLLEREEDYRRYRIVPEDDALLVKTHLASAVVEKTLRQSGEALADARAAFLAWLRTLAVLSPPGPPEGAAIGCGVKVQAALRLALEGLPAGAFDVAPAPLAVKGRAWAGIPGAFQELLASRKIDYDAVAAEAARRLAEAGPADALKALSSLVEENPGDGVLTRDVAFSALEWGLAGHAYHLLRVLAASRPCEAPLYPLLARALSQADRPDLALAFYELALSGEWDNRFGEMRAIVAFEYTNFLRRVTSGGGKLELGDLARARLESLEKEQGLAKADLAVSILWNTDGTDVDLHVTEPGGEECFYQHPSTKIGGKLTKDVTQGYGPEMYVLRDAVPGEYRIRVHYYASDRNRASARTRVLATVIRDAGTPAAKVERRAVALSSSSEFHDLLTVTVGK